MIDDEQYSEAVSEVLEILKYSDDEIVERIPLEVIKVLNKEKSNTYVPNIDFTKDLSQINLRSETLSLLAALYRDYICTEEEREEFNKMLHEYNGSKYKNVDVFDKKQNSEKNEETNLALVKQEKSIWQKIIGKLFKRS